MGGSFFLAYRLNVFYMLHIEIGLSNNPQKMMQFIPKLYSHFYNEFKMKFNFID
jgi:hypothetical protein